jgi:hypothetical protein
MLEKVERSFELFHKMNEKKTEKKRRNGKKLLLEYFMSSQTLLRLL